MVLSMKLASRLYKLSGSIMMSMKLAICVDNV
uniref:Uncharacterized protein n=1 Tax=Arundo donax TaxID=35708 RepID=A0A0A9BLZ6_ARUDO